MAHVPSKVQSCIVAHKGPVQAVCFNKQGEYIISGGQDRLIKLWNATTNACINEYEGHGWEVLDVVISPDNTKFVSCGRDKAVFLWDAMQKGPIRKFQGHLQRINCVAINEEGTVVLSGSFDATVRIWDCRSHSRAPIQILAEARDSVSSVIFTDHDIISGSIDGNIRCYDIRMGIIKVDFVGNGVTNIYQSSDANCILASSLDSKIRLFDKENGQLLNDYTGHVCKDYKIRSCLDYTDAFVLSGSEDGNVYCWDLVEGELLQVLKKHTDVVSAIAAHPKKQIIASGSFDGNVVLWE